MLYGFLKGLFLFFDHKIVREQWLSFKTSVLKLLLHQLLPLSSLFHIKAARSSQEGDAANLGTSHLACAGAEPAVGTAPCPTL